MDIGSGLRSRPDREESTGGRRTGARTDASLVLLAALALLVLVALVGATFLPEPGSEPLLSGPFRWQK